MYENIKMSDTQKEPNQTRPCKAFPISNPPRGCYTSIPWEQLDEHHARKIHGQTLVKLASRGTLSTVLRWLTLPLKVALISPCVV